MFACPQRRSMDAATVLGTSPRRRFTIYLRLPGLIPSPFGRSASSLHLQEWGNGRVSHERAGDFRYQVSVRVDHEISVQDFARADSRACAGPAEADLSSQGGGDHTRCGGTESDPHAGVGAAGHGASQVGAVSEGRSSRRLQDEFWELRKRYWGSPCGRGAILRECGRSGRGNDQEIH
jgi:hypothetical protein